MLTIADFNQTAAAKGYDSPEFGVFRKTFTLVSGEGCTVHIDPHTVTVCRPSAVPELNLAGIFPSMADADELLRQSILKSEDLAELHLFWQGLQQVVKDSGLVLLAGLSISATPACAWF